MHKEVRLVGNFNSWNGEGYDLHRVNNEGVWIIVMNQDLKVAYKYEIITSQRRKNLKI